MFHTLASSFLAATAFALVLSLSGAGLAGGKPLPADSDMKAAKALVIETFRKELSAADKAPAIRAMLDTAAKTEGDADLAALYLSAADVAARAGETRLAFEAVEQLASRFDIDLLSLKETLLDSAARYAKTNEARVSISNRGIELAGDAARAGRFDVADSALKLASAASAKVKDADLRKDIAAKRKEIEKAKRQHEQALAALAGARQTLKENPDESEANETLGKHLAFENNDWTAGLKHLAKSSDADLKQAARADQSGAADQAKALGDLWWNLGDRAGPPKADRDKAGYRSRAVFWYTRALNGLTGLQRNLIEKRIAEAGADALSRAADQTDADPAKAGKFIDITLAPGVLMRLVKIPASADGKVKSFFLGQTEVTQKQWQAVMGGNPSNFVGDNNPVNYVTHAECREFCKRLNESRAGTRLEVRFPTVDEWMHAILAGQSLDDALRSLRSCGWNSSNSGDHAHPVMQLPRSAWGLYDMQGNCWEWTNDAHKALGGSYDRPENADGGKLLPAIFHSDDAKAHSIGFRVAAEAR